MGFGSEEFKVHGGGDQQASSDMCETDAMCARIVYGILL